MNENPLSHRALWALGLAGAGAALGLGVYLATRSTQATVSSVDNSGPTVNNTPQGQVTPSENS
jgi:hypothetical protein